VLPAMGYSGEQLADLEQTIDEAAVDVVVSGTPIDLGRLIRTSRRLIKRDRFGRSSNRVVLRAVVLAFERGASEGVALSLVLSTSANRPGEPPAVRVESAPAGIADLAVDGGSRSGVPSTIVRVDSSGVRVLRQGAISLGDHGLDAPGTSP